MRRKRKRGRERATVRRLLLATRQEVIQQEQKCATGSVHLSTDDDGGRSLKLMMSDSDGGNYNGFEEQGSWFENYVNVSMLLMNSGDGAKACV